MILALPAECLFARARAKFSFSGCTGATSPINTGLAPCFGGCHGCHKGATHSKLEFGITKYDVRALSDKNLRKSHSKIAHREICVRFLMFFV